MVPKTIEYQTIRLSASCRLLVARRNGAWKAKKVGNEFYLSLSNFDFYYSRVCAHAQMQMRAIFNLFAVFIPHFHSSVQ